MAYGTVLAEMAAALGGDLDGMPFRSLSIESWKNPARCHGTWFDKKRPVLVVFIV
jgi:hypothetical protein